MGGKSQSQRDREWAQIYSIYGSDEWPTILFLLFNSLLFLLLSSLVLIYNQPLKLFTIFSGAFLLIISLLSLLAASSLLHSSSLLRWQISHRMLSSVPDWSSVRTSLDIGSGRGFLTNSISLHLKKLRCPGRVVGLAPSRAAAVSALRRANIENVQEYVTFREGDSRALPFADGFFDVAMSAVHFSRMGKTPEERGRGIGEMVRVLKGGGVGVVWDLNCVPEYVQRLREMGMEDIRVSERISAYLVGSHIVSFRKPIESAVVYAAADWRTNIC